MDFREVVQIVGTIVAIVASVSALWKSFKMYPNERANSDATASATYATAAKGAAEQVNHALKRIDSLELRSKELSGLITALQDKIHQRDQCIETMTKEIGRLNDELKARDRLIESWAKGIRTLITQIVDSGNVPNWSPESLSLTNRST